MTNPTGNRENPTWSSELLEFVRQVSAKEGFEVSGVASIGSASEELDRVETKRFKNWVESGRAGEMEYLKRVDEEGVLQRSAVSGVFPWAHSVLVCGFNYNSAGPLSIEDAPKGTGWIARYAWSGRKSEGSAVSDRLQSTDYHKELLDRLSKVEAELQGRLPCQTKCYVDTGPIVERALAARAGIGWIGKNTCVLHERQGSWMLLGVVITSIALPESFEVAAADRCGSCTRCLDACPTGALVGPREMDASLCISYLTIEKKGNIPTELRQAVGRQVFGCDICQDVCPWNRRAPIAVKEGMLPRRELVNPALDWLASLDATEFRQYFSYSPLERTKQKRLNRNIAIAMGNSGEERFLPRLRVWSESSDEVLAETAKWAIDQVLSR